MRIPSKEPEDSPIPHVRRMQRKINQLIEAMQANQIQQSAATRIERTPGGIFIYPKIGTPVAGGGDDTWY